MSTTKNVYLFDQDTFEELKEIMTSIPNNICELKFKEDANFARNYMRSLLYHDSGILCRKVCCFVLPIVSGDFPNHSDCTCNITYEVSTIQKCHLFNKSLIDDISDLSCTRGWCEIKTICFIYNQLKNIINNCYNCVMKEFEMKPLSSVIDKILWRNKSVNDLFRTKVKLSEAQKIHRHITSHGVQYCDSSWTENGVNVWRYEMPVKIKSHVIYTIRIAFEIQIDNGTDDQSIHVYHICYEARRIFDSSVRRCLEKDNNFPKITEYYEAEKPDFL